MIFFDDLLPSHPNLFQRKCRLFILGLILGPILCLQVHIHRCFDAFLTRLSIYCIEKDCDRINDCALQTVIVNTFLYYVNWHTLHSRCRSHYKGSNDVFVSGHLRRILHRYVWGADPSKGMVMQPVSVLLTESLTTSGYAAGIS